MVQILSTQNHFCACLRLKFLTAYFGLIGEQLKRGSEQSTNVGLSEFTWFIQSREDMNHPPTAVGGIWTFCAKASGLPSINKLGVFAQHDAGHISHFRTYSEQRSCFVKRS